MRPNCRTKGCDDPVVDGRIWCEKHNFCQLCGKLSVEWRHVGKPRCQDHQSVKEPEDGHR